MSADIGANFCDNNHLRGNCSESVVSFGAFYKSCLFAVMTFSIVRYNVWKLDRYCCDSVVDDVDVYADILSSFENSYSYSELITYVDFRWSVGNMCNSAGFNLIERIKPVCWYFKGNSKRVNALSLTNSTGDYYSKYNRIWDCGNLKFSKK